LIIGRFQLLLAALILPTCLIGGHMRRFRAAVFGLFALAAHPALANCQPPPPGLGPQDWYALCTNEINWMYQNQNPGGLDYDTYVSAVYAAYVQASLGGGGASGLVGGQCSPDGTTMCNSSGWLQTCAGGIWTTGATQC
jgi:hypothetical protein